MAKASEEKGEKQSNIEAAQEAAAEQFKILTGTNDQFKPTFEDKLKAYVMC